MPSATSHCVSPREDALDACERASTPYPAVLECWLTSGEVHDHQRVCVRDLADDAHIRRRCLARLPGVAAVRSRCAMRRVTAWRGYAIES